MLSELPLSKSLVFPGVRKRIDWGEDLADFSDEARDLLALYALRIGGEPTVVCEVDSPKLTALLRKLESSSNFRGSL